MKTCKHVIELLTEYLEGDLPVDDRHTLDEHLGFCPPCVDYMNQLKKLGPLARECIATEGVPPSVAARLEDFLREQCAKKKS